MAISRQQVEEFLYREARYLDDRQWDDWLALYQPHAEFWMPSWDDDDKLVENPQTEISLMYYASKQGLEDRVFRIRTERSSATVPDTRARGGNRRTDGAVSTTEFRGKGSRPRGLRVRGGTCFPVRTRARDLVAPC